MEEIEPKRTNSVITIANRWDHFLARFSINRNGHRIEPGLYTIGAPNADSPVFVTANYTLSFDALRSSLKGIDGYILVLDTKGINVWCAAGKGTFATDELVNRIEATGLSKIVTHRKLIVPQLGATGVAVQQVKQRSGFTVKYGPIRADDLPRFLETGQATLEMRRVNFNFWDRLVLAPVEFVGALIPMLIIAVLAYLYSGLVDFFAVVAAVSAGTVLFPVLLPWIPTRNFSTKGIFLGIIASAPFIYSILFSSVDKSIWEQSFQGIVYLMMMPAITAFFTLNFTGASTFTSKTGVKREMYRYIPVMAWMFGGGIVIIITMTAYNYFGV